MQCQPLPQLTVTAAGTPVPITAQQPCAVLQIQAATTNGSNVVLVKCNSAVIAQLTAGSTWSTPGQISGNPYTPSSFAIDATANGAVAIVTAWYR
jgi:hypothetical protein